MKAIVKLSLMLLIFVASCKKEDDQIASPAPTVNPEVVGTWEQKERYIYNANSAGGVCNSGQDFVIEDITLELKEDGNYIFNKGKISGTYRYDASSKEITLNDFKLNNNPGSAYPIKLFFNIHTIPYNTSLVIPASKQSPSIYWTTDKSDKTMVNCPTFQGAASYTCYHQWRLYKK